MYIFIPSWALVPTASVEQQLMNTTYLKIEFWEAEDVGENILPHNIIHNTATMK